MPAAVADAPKKSTKSPHHKPKPHAFDRDHKLTNAQACPRCRVAWSYQLHERVETNNGLLHPGCVAATDKVIDRRSFGSGRVPEPAPKSAPTTKEFVKAAVTAGAENADGTYDAAKVFANVAAITAAASGAPTAAPRKRKGK